MHLLLFSGFLGSGKTTLIIPLSHTTGLILSSGCDVPVNAKPENVEAFVAAAREYGKIS